MASSACRLIALMNCWIAIELLARWALHLTHWGRVTHICVSKTTIIGSDNGLSPGRRQAIIWTNAGILLIGPLGTTFSEFFIGTQTFSFKKMYLKMSSAKWRPFCLGLNVLISACYRTGRVSAWTIAYLIHIYMFIIYFDFHQSLVYVRNALS